VAREALKVGIVVERRALKSPWADHVWLPVAVLPGASAAAPWTLLERDGSAERYYAGALDLEFFSSETGMYRNNLLSGRLTLWVVMAVSPEPPGVALKAVTADPAEGEAYTEPGTEIVEAVPMPAEIAERLQAFVAAHHVERPFVKRQRDRADPEALAARPRVGGDRK
jgi:hypothetical protein